MKKRVLLGMAALLLSVSLLMAQEIPAGVITAFKRGSSQELSKYMGGKVNLVLQGRSTNVDKQKATAMMQDFFTENKVSGFNVNHQGKRDESSFIIGTLAASPGAAPGACPAAVPIPVSFRERSFIGISPCSRDALAAAFPV